MPDSPASQLSGQVDPSANTVDQWLAKARSVAGQDQFDYAIYLLLCSLKSNPEHAESQNCLRRWPAQRQAAGLPALPLGEVILLKRPAANDKLNLCNALRLYAHDPENTNHLHGIVTHSLKLGLKGTILWAGPQLLRHNRQAAPPDFKKFIALKDAYAAIEEWARAIEAAECALQFRPAEHALKTDITRLQARLAMARGHYDSPAGFMASVVPTSLPAPALPSAPLPAKPDPRTQAAIQARTAWQVDPTMENLKAYIAALERTEQPDYENQAIELLKEIFAETQELGYRLQLGQIKITQLKREEKVASHAACENRRPHASRGLSHFPHRPA